MAIIINFTVGEPKCEEEPKCEDELLRSLHLLQLVDCFWRIG